MDYGNAKINQHALKRDKVFKMLKLEEEKAKYYSMLVALHHYGYRIGLNIQNIHPV